MIIDCHGHYTTEAKAQLEWRQAQLKMVEAGDFKPTRALLSISDDYVREGIEGNQLKQQQEQNDGMGAGNSRKGTNGSPGPMCKVSFNILLFNVGYAK